MSSATHDERPPIADRTAVVGVGATPYYRRGHSLPQTPAELTCKAILSALADAGLTVDDLDGFALYAGGYDPAQVAALLGVPEVRFAATLTSGGGGAAGSLGLAAAAIVCGMADVVVSVMVLQQAHRRAGGSSAAAGSPIAGNAIYGGGGSSPEDAFSAPSGLASPGQNFSLLAQRHMHRYGTTRAHFAEVAISQRNNAIRRPGAMMRTPLTLND